MDVSAAVQVSPFEKKKKKASNHELMSTSGAQIVFHSFIHPIFSRFFPAGSTSANLRAQADAATKPHST